MKQSNACEHGTACFLCVISKWWFPSPLCSLPPLAPRPLRKGVQWCFFWLCTEDLQELEGALCYFTWEAPTGWRMISISLTDAGEHVSCLTLNMMIRSMCMCAQFSLTIWNPMDCSPPGSSIHGIPRQEYWSGLPLPSPGDLPDSGIKLPSLASPALAGCFFTTMPPKKPWSGLS